MAADPKPHQRFVARFAEVRHAYLRTGRWLLAAAVIAGWAVRWIVLFPRLVAGQLLGVFAGAVTLVALKEELPTERAGHYGAFVAGVVAYAALLQLL